MNVIKPLEGEQYENYINRILENRSNQHDNNAYQERHHIMPRCMGGEDTEENLIYLYAQEHYYAHKLLALENPDNYKILNAWIMMAFKTSNSETTERNYEISAEEYALAKEINSKMVSERFKGKKQTEEHINKRKMVGSDNPMYGKKGELNPNYGKHYGQKENNPFYGKHHTSETKEKISKKNKGKLAGSKNPSSKAVVCLETLEVFLTIREAALWCNTSVYGSNIIKSCKDVNHMISCGRHPETHEKLHWRYATDEEKQNKINGLNVSVETAGLSE